jgi:hypothetical protein
MADETDEEFRTAYAAFGRSWIGLEFFGSEEAFEDGIDQLIKQGGSATQMLRAFHAEHGRYPSFEEIFPPGGPVLGIIPDIE